MPNSDKLKQSLRRLNVVLTAAIILAAVILGVQIVRRYYLNPPPSFRIGSKATIEGVDAGAYDRVLVLAYSTDCHYCSDSASTYKRLINALSRGKQVRRTALLPQPVEQSKSYLDQIGIAVDDIRQATLQKLGIYGVPMLAAIDRNGVVSHLWSGSISIEEQFMLFDEVGLQYRDLLPTDEIGPTLIDVSILPSLVRDRSDVLVLDTRNRDEYQKQHFSPSINIPVDEIEARAAEELPVNATLVVIGADRRTASAAADWLMVTHHTKPVGVVELSPSKQQ